MESDDDAVMADLAGAEDEEEVPVRWELAPEEEEWVWSVEAAIVAGGSVPATDPGDGGCWSRLLRWARWIQDGRYERVLREMPYSLRREASFHELSEKATTTTTSAASPTLRLLTARCEAFQAQQGAVGVRELTMLAAAATRAYEQLNYAGPADADLVSTAAETLGELTTTDRPTTERQTAAEALEFAGEPIAPFCACPELLVLARAAAATASSANLAGAWWSARAATYHGRVLSTRARSSVATRTLWEQVVKPSFDGLLSGGGVRGGVDDEARLCRGEKKTCGASSLASSSRVLCGDLRALALLERGLAKHHFDEDGRGKTDFSLAAKAAGLEVELTAALGKRTKFQKKSLPQLRLDVKRDDAPATTTTTGMNKGGPPLEKNQQGLKVITPPVGPGSSSFDDDCHDDDDDDDDAPPPKTPSSEGSTPPPPARRRPPRVVPLSEDSILFETGVKFDEEDKEDDARGTDRDALDGDALRQAILLALCLDVKNSNPEDDGLTVEEMRPYVDAAAAEPKNWLVYSTALLQRCRLELTSSYSADRAALQMQVLVDQHATVKTKGENGVSDAPARDRVKFVSALDYPAIWEAKGELAATMAGLGALITAAELYATLNRFDAVVECYAGAGRRDAALLVLKEQVSQGKATPHLWCVLGDLEDAPKHYETAWASSKERCARAARSLGRRFARKKQWREAIPWLERALHVAPFAPATWFDLGIAEMRLAVDAASMMTSRPTTTTTTTASSSPPPEPPSSSPNNATAKRVLGATQHSPEARWRAAARAFSRAAAQEPDDADSWANLAAVQIQLRELKPALAALDAALKIRGDDWRLWENATRVASALGDRPAVVLRGLSKLLDLRAKSRRPVDSFLDQLAAVVDQVAVLEASVAALPETDARRFNAARAASLLDQFADRLLREAPAVPGDATAKLWDLLALRAGAQDDRPRLRDLRARKARALLRKDDRRDHHHDARLFEALLEFADACAEDDTCGPNERRSAALFLRAVLERFHRDDKDRRQLLKQKADDLQR